MMKLFKILENVFQRLKLTNFSHFNIPNKSASQYGKKIKSLELKIARLQLIEREFSRLQSLLHLGETFRLFRGRLRKIYSQRDNLRRFQALTILRNHNITANDFNVISRIVYERNKIAHPPSKLFDDDTNWTVDNEIFEVHSRVQRALIDLQTADMKNVKSSDDRCEP